MLTCIRSLSHTMKGLSTLSWLFSYVFFYGVCTAAAAAVYLDSGDKCQHVGRVLFPGAYPRCTAFELVFTGTISFFVALNVAVWPFLTHTRQWWENKHSFQRTSHLVYRNDLFKRSIAWSSREKYHSGSVVVASRELSEGNI